MHFLHRSQSNFLLDEIEAFGLAEMTADERGVVSAPTADPNRDRRDCFEEVRYAMGNDAVHDTNL